MNINHMNMANMANMNNMNSVMNMGGMANSGPMMNPTARTFIPPQPIPITPQPSQNQGPPPLQPGPLPFNGTSQFAPGSNGSTNAQPNSSSSNNSETAPQNSQIGNLRKTLTNSAILRVLEICELIGRTDNFKEFGYWQRLVPEIFAENGVLRYSVKNGNETRHFEFTVPIIARFFFSIIQSGVIRMEIVPSLLRSQVLPNGTIYVESSKVCTTHWYPDGSHVLMHGNTKILFNQQLKMEWMDLQVSKFSPGFDWASLESLLDSQLAATGMDTKNYITSNFQVFKCMNNFGLQESVMRVMQVGDVMAHLKSLMAYSTQNEANGPLNALENYVRHQNSQMTALNRQRLQQQQQTNPIVVKPPPSNNSPSPTTITKDPISSTTPISQTGDTPSSLLSKTPNLDISQSTLTKRRKMSTINDSSSQGPSPKSSSPRMNGKSKKAKR